MEKRETVFPTGIQMSFRNKKKQKFNRAKSYQKLETLSEARDLLDQGLFFDALRCLTEAVRNYPSEIRFWEMLAAVSTELDDGPSVQTIFVFACFERIILIGEM